MVVHVHGFDWAVYAERVMPAFARWLIDRDETTIYQLFEQTRCALEETFLPDPMQHLRVWPRAKAFVDTLPRGPHSRKEYAKLCSVDQFTALSDNYLHNHAPHLYQNSNAVRSVWGAIIEEYCLPWSHASEQEASIEQMTSELMPNEQTQTVRSELVSLLHEAGLGELAREVGEQVTEVERFVWEPDEGEDYDLYEDEENTDAVRPKGVIIGQHPNILHLRGWLASASVRAMALFEYLGSGRRCMPFGYEPGEPFGAYIGYLTPDEVWHMATSLRDVKPPDQAEAEKDYQNFCHQREERQETFRLIDEVLPAYANEFLRVVRRSALQGLGLICSVE